MPRTISEEIYQAILGGAVSLALLALCLVVPWPAFAGGVSVDVACPKAVDPDTDLFVDVTLESDGAATGEDVITIKRLAVAIVGNADDTLLALIISGPKTRAVDVELLPGMPPITIFDIKVQKGARVAEWNARAFSEQMES